MSTLEQMRQSLGRTLETLGEGWQRLLDRAGQALTRFRPLSRRDDVDTWEDQVVQRAAGWGVLATEIHEDGEQLRVRLEVPGMEAEDFDIDVVDNILVVRGEKRVSREQQDGRFHVMECAYGSFERAIPLPVEVKGHEARARYRRGVLTVELPKQEHGRSRRITVQSA